MLPSGTSVTLVFQRQKGNALFLILIGVALFAALSYAVTKSTRGTGSITKEKAILDSGLAQQCVATVERAVSMLKLVGKCPDDQVSYELPDGTNENPLNPSDKSCFVFDKLGGDTTPCGAWLSSLGCNLTALAVGEKCTDSDVIYAGISGGRRIYTTSSNQGSDLWCAGGTLTSTGATSTSDGLANTNILVALADGCAPYNAALACRALGPKWYLPANDELDLLYSVKHTGALNGTFTEVWSVAGLLWSSTELFQNNSYYKFFGDGTFHDTLKNIGTESVRCVRRD